MKTTLELPDELMREVKMRAVEEDQKLRDMVAELLRIGLANRSLGAETSRVGSIFPIFSGGHPALPENEMTPDRVAEILLEDEVDRALGR